MLYRCFCQYLFSVLKKIFSGNHPNRSGTAGYGSKNSLQRTDFLPGSRWIFRAPGGQYELFCKTRIRLRLETFRRELHNLDAVAVGIMRPELQAFGKSRFRLAIDRRPAFFQCPVGFFQRIHLKADVAISNRFRRMDIRCISSREQLQKLAAGDIHINGSGIPVVVVHTERLRKAHDLPVKPRRFLNVFRAQGDVPQCCNHFFQLLFPARLGRQCLLWILYLFFTPVTRVSPISRHINFYRHKNLVDFDICYRRFYQIIIAY